MQLSWNLFGGGSNLAGRSSAKYEMKAAESRLALLRKELARNIESLEINMESLLQRIRKQEEAVQLSRENYEDARGQYRAGMITVTQLGDFNLAYSEARFNLAALHYSMRILIIEARGLLFRDGVEQK